MGISFRRSRRIDEKAFCIFYGGNMLRKSAFKRSQAFHQKQLDKHIVKSGSRESDIKTEYHARVLQLQHRSGKIVPRKEREVLYAREHNRVYGGTDKEIPCKSSDWRKIVNKYY